MQVTMTIV